MNFLLCCLNFGIVGIFFFTNGCQLLLSCGNLVCSFGKGVCSCLGSVVHYLSDNISLCLINTINKLLTGFFSLFV